MELSLVTSKLRSHFPLFREPVETDPKQAAVLILLFAKNNECYILMIERAFHLRLHPGEIAFPGGVYKSEDGDFLGTALRETREEIGVGVAEAAVFARLPFFITRTGYQVAPFVSQLETRPEYQAAAAEVNEVLEIPLSALFSTHQPDSRFDPEEDKAVYWYDKYRIWGASANMLRKIQLTLEL